VCVCVCARARAAGWQRMGECRRERVCNVHLRSGSDHPILVFTHCVCARVRVLQGGNVWEKAGVNVSVVYGSMPPEAYRCGL